MLSRLDRRYLILLSLLLLGSVLVTTPMPNATGQVAKSKTYLFCFWNVENFFDDKVNPKHEHAADREFDTWYAKDKQALEMKLERLCTVLLSKEMNNGKGPDILALAEIESERSVELLKIALNHRLKDKTLHYSTVVYRDPAGGRNIATAVLSRVPVVNGQTRLLGRMQRILRVNLKEGTHEMTVVASHWSARVSDKTGRGRTGYARQIHDDFAAAYKRNPKVQYLVCGDFNDTPDDPSVSKDLNATGDLGKVLGLNKSDKAMFYNPFADLAKAGKGTHYFGTKAYVFDNICVSPGMLDSDGWAYVNKSAHIIEQMTFRGHPDRFGGPEDKRPWRNRGASDHYPVTIQLRVPLGK